MKLLASIYKTTLMYIKLNKYEINFLIVGVVIIGSCCLLKQWIEPLYPKEFTIFELVYGILFSFLSSLIFYYFLVYIPEKRQKLFLKPFISRQSWVIIGRANSAYSALAKAAYQKLNITETPNFDQLSIHEIDKICKNVDPHDYTAVLNIALQKMSFWEYLYSQYSLSKKAFDEILKYIKFVDAKCIRLLNDINSSSYFFILESIVSMRFNFRNKDFSILSKDLFEYFEKIKKLKKYLIEEGFKEKGLN